MTNFLADPTQGMEGYEARHFGQMRQLAPDCMVVLQRTGRFPLAAPGNVALFGNGARHTVQGGTGSGSVNSRRTFTVEEALVGSGFNVVSGAWLDAYDKARVLAREEFIAAVKREARAAHQLTMLYGMGKAVPEPDYDLPLETDAETAVYVLSRTSGEGADRMSISGDVKLSSAESRDINALAELYPNFMLVLNVGGPVDLSGVPESCDILLMSQLGVAGPWALADVLLGKALPTGKLSTTWAAWEDYPTLGDFGTADDARYSEGIYVGYRYFEAAGVKPLFPFGHGLGYTDFAMRGTEMRVDGTNVVASVRLENTGAYPGKEVVQLYVSKPWVELDQPRQDLAAFAKTDMLLPGESVSVDLEFSLRDIASFDAARCAWVLEAGDYVLRVGTSSADAEPNAILRLTETVVVRQVESAGMLSEFQVDDWKPERPPEHGQAEWAEHLTVFEVDAGVFASKSDPEPAQPSAEALARARALSDDELARITMGGLSTSGVAANVIGGASVNVAGAAGETWGQIDGVPTLVMADGPAGIRVSQQYVESAAGQHAIGSTIPLDMEMFMGSVLKSVAKLAARPPKGRVRGHYATSIPIGTALAQSFDVRLCEACGDMVGDEMEHIGVHLWLAPALNVHRSILCGRNFEYFSEDPLVSGLCSAALCRGVQRHEGRGVTLKHFCCNNQETNRYGSNSVVSERALRELYLRGFEIAIREGRPMALMTSYNLLNGIHTTERKDLLAGVVRNEWGYEGVIMTDWIVSMIKSTGRYRSTLPVPALQAGTNLFMPGSKGDFRAVARAMREGVLGRARMEANAAWVIQAAWRLRSRS